MKPVAASRRGGIWMWGMAAAALAAAGSATAAPALTLEKAKANLVTIAALLRADPGIAR